MDGIRGAFASAISGDVPIKLWHDLIYAGSINTVAGPSGIGKSQVTVKMAADFSRTIGNVIYCNAEDDEAIQAYRLDASGADMDKVRLASYKIPLDLAALRYAIAADGAKLLILDTAVKHFSANSGTPLPIQKWDGALADLRLVLAESGCAAVFVHHTLKSIKSSASWHAALGGTTAGLAGTSRAIALFGIRPDEPSQVVYCPVKDAYAAPPKAIAFERRTEEYDMSDGRTVEIGYLGIAEKDLSITNPTELVVVGPKGDGTSGPTPEKAAAAAAFLTSALSAGPIPLKDVGRCVTHPGGRKVAGKAECGHLSPKALSATKGKCPYCGGDTEDVTGLEWMAEQANVSNGTMKRAKEALTIVSERKGSPSAPSGALVYWRLPTGHPGLNPTAPEVLP